MNRNQMIAAVSFLVIIVYFLTAPNRFAKNQERWAWLRSREGMVNKKCPDGTRSDGPCLLEFPGF